MPQPNLGPRSSDRRVQCPGFQLSPAAQTFGGTISGSGILTQGGTGILILTASNTYTGGTMISAGTLQVGNGLSGDSIGSTSGVLNNASLILTMAIRLPSARTSAAAAA